MKNYLSTILLCTTCAISAQQLIKSDISSGGNTLVETNISAIYSIGEVFINEYNNGSTIISEGFINSKPTQTLSIDSQIIEPFKIYPNPVINNLNIVNLQGNVTYSISDNSGKIIMSGELWTNSYKINVAPLASGLYIIAIKGEDNLKVSKFIKK